MAVGTVLKMVFETTMGQKTITFKYADPSATTQSIKTLMDTIISNGSIYKYPPLSKVSAILETTSQATIDVS